MTFAAVDEAMLTSRAPASQLLNITATFECDADRFCLSTIKLPI